MSTKQIGCQGCDTTGDVKTIRVSGTPETYCGACWMRVARRRGMAVVVAATIYAYAQ